MKNIEQIMSRFSKEELSQGVEQVKRLMSTPEGEQIRRRIASMDKAQLLKKLNQLDSSSSGQGTKSISNKEILDKLNQFCNGK